MFYLRIISGAGLVRDYPFYSLARGSAAIISFNTRRIKQKNLYEERRRRLFMEYFSYASF